MRERFALLDVVRGIAVIMMIAFHLVYDLHFFFGVQTLAFRSGFWYYEGRVTAILFIMLTGVVSALLARKYAGKELWRKNLLRGLRVLLFASLVTLVTWLYWPDMTIYFGILHFLSFGILLSLFFVRFAYANIFFALVFIILGTQFQSFAFDSYWLFPLGFSSSSIASFDYYPFFPWFGVLLLGIAAANIFRVGFSLQFSRLGVLGFAGRHSLAIYLVHQPILLGLLYLFL